MNAKCLRNSFKWIIGFDVSLLVDQFYSLSKIEDVDFSNNQEETDDFNFYVLGETKRQYDKVINIFLKEDLYFSYKKSLGFFSDNRENKIKIDILKLLSSKKIIRNKNKYFDFIIKKMLSKNKGLNYVRTWS